MFVDALESMKNNMGTTLFIWLTYYFTIIFIFLFFSISMSDGIGVTMINSKNDLPTNLMVYSIVVCSIEIFFANRFFMKKISHRIATRMICGSTYFQLAGFLMIQSIILMGTSIVHGILTSVMVVPFINVIIANVSSTTFHVQITPQALLWTSLVIGYVVFWSLILDLSFTYKNSPSELLNTSKVKIQFDELTALFQKIPIKVRNVVVLCAWLIPLIYHYIYMMKRLLYVY